MKIIYGQNPLAAKVILTEAEKKELWYKIKITQLEDLVFNTYYYLQDKNFNLAEAFQHVDTLNAAILFLENQINVSASCLHKTDKKAALDYCNNYKNINFLNG